MGEHTAGIRPSARLIALGAVTLGLLSGCSALGATDASSSPSATVHTVGDASAPPAPTTSTAPLTTASATPSATPSASASAPAPSPTPSASTAPKTRSVTPFITLAVWEPDAKRLDVSAIVPDVVETDGTCHAVAKLDGVRRTADGQAVPTAQSTGCAPMVLTGLTAGRWAVTVSYSSKESSGTSDVKHVKVTQ